MGTQLRTLAALVLCGFCLAAAAQTPGIGETRPLPQEQKAPPGGETTKPPADSDRNLKRCDGFSGTLREDCLREQRAADGAAAGASRRPEPPTAPPPTNPTGR